MEKIKIITWVNSKKFRNFLSASIYLVNKMNRCTLLPFFNTENIKKISQERKVVVQSKHFLSMSVSIK